MLCWAPAMAKAAWPPSRQTGPRPSFAAHSRSSSGPRWEESAGPQPFGSSLVGGGQNGTALHGVFPTSSPDQAAPSVLLHPVAQFPRGAGLRCTPMVGMPGQAELPMGCRGHPGSSWPGQVPHLHHWQPARHKPVLTPQGHSPSTGCAGCVEHALAQPGWHPLCQHAGHPASPRALHRRPHPCGDTLGLHPEVSEVDTIPPKH